MSEEQTPIVTDQPEDPNYIPVSSILNQPNHNIIYIQDYNNTSPNDFNNNTAFNNNINNNNNNYNYNYNYNNNNNNYNNNYNYNYNSDNKNNNNNNNIYALEDQRNEKKKNIIYLIMAILIFIFLVVESIFYIANGVFIKIYFIHFDQLAMLILAFFYIKKYKEKEESAFLNCLLPTLNIAVWFCGFAMRGFGMVQMKKNVGLSFFFIVIRTFGLFFCIPITSKNCR